MISIHSMKRENYCSLSPPFIAMKKVVHHMSRPMKSSTLTGKKMSTIAAAKIRRQKKCVHIGARYTENVIAESKYGDLGVEERESGVWSRRGEESRSVPFLERERERGEGRGSTDRSHGRGEEEITKN